VAYTIFKSWWRIIVFRVKIWRFCYHKLYERLLFIICHRFLLLLILTLLLGFSSSQPRQAIPAGAALMLASALVFF